MKVKDGVDIWSLDISMRPVLKFADRIWKAHGQELVVTSGRDNIHSAGSLHYYGYALDFRTRFWSDEESRDVATEFQARLNEYADGKYRVIFEGDHIHVHYRPPYSLPFGYE